VGWRAHSSPNSTLASLDSALIKSGVDAGWYRVRTHRGPSVISVSERRSLFAAFQATLQRHATFFKMSPPSSSGKKEAADGYKIIFLCCSSRASQVKPV
jgi:hypothetical protein